MFTLPIDDRGNFYCYLQQGIFIGDNSVAVHEVESKAILAMDKVARGKH